MEGGDGMVAVVRGLRDSGLAVTLLDGSRQYTLMPNAVATPQHSPPSAQPSPTHVHVMQRGARAQTQETSEPPRCNSAAQATDGRYASMYKMAHCSVMPTSPPVQLTEFPPQRAELCRGHGNFEVGGSGSGENYTPCRSNGSFRGAMSWPDRESVCSPRPSREPDAFANSLRKYPNISVERSTEMVERLITYTQAKNISKTYQGRYPSPSRHESTTSSHYAVDRNTSRNTVARTGSYQRTTYEPEVNISCKAKPRLEESPTRDLRTDDCADYRKQMVKENKYLKDATKKIRDNLRSLSAYPYSQPAVSPVIRERYELNNNFNNNTFGQRSPMILTATNSVNMEVQAAAKMVSKEVATVPRSDPLKRTVAVPLSPTSSSEDQKPEGDVSRRTILNSNRPTYKSVETGSMPTYLSVQTTSSSNHVESPRHNWRYLNINSKSDEDLYKDFGEEIFELLDKVSVCPNSDPQACDLRREVLKQMSVKLQRMSQNIDWSEGTENTRNQIGRLLKYVPIWAPCGDIQAYRDAISDEIMTRMNRYTNNDVYRAEPHYNITNEEKNLKELLETWITHIPFKSFEIFGKPVEKERIIEVYLYRIKRLIMNKKNRDRGLSLKSDIVNIISKLPIAINECDKTQYLDNQVERLLNKLESKKLRHFDNKFAPEPYYKIQRRRSINRHKKYIQPTGEEIRVCILDELNHLFDRFSNSADTKDVEIEIIDYLIDSIEALRAGNDTFVESELITLICLEIDNITWYDARYIAQKLVDLVKNKFTSIVANQEGSHSIATQSYVVLQNTASLCPHPNTNDGMQNSSDFSIGSISEGDIDFNLDAYMNQLTVQIDEWLASLQMEIPQAHDSGFRQVVVHDLAGDIIDRHKYLELNHLSKGSENDELDHLKYQIFKWINKLAGEDNMESIEHAPELMQRIRSIPVPMLTNPKQRCGPPNQPNANMSMSRGGDLNTIQGIPMPVNQSRPNLNQSQARTDMAASCCSSAHLKPSTPSMKQLNEEYDEFLKKWVQEIPIPSSTPAEKALADKARAGIYNGVWKAITKLKFEPATFNNLFYYEDALDDEIEELLSALPKTSELETKKHLLKVQLIERTTNTNELIKSTAAPASFKQQLVENVSNILPRNNKDPKQSNEELQIHKLVEDYILCVNYKETDQAKANVYRKKLIQEAQTLVDNLKTSQGKKLQVIDTDMYINSIFNVLHKVPLPNKETVKDEAEEIMLGAEVEQWLSDLPILPNNKNKEQLQRKKLKDILVKKIREIENDVNIFDCTGERVLKHEISSFLQKVPMQQGENLNLTFMAEEFANRMKNRAKQLQGGNAPRKSVAFMDSVGYYEFSQHMPHCSSFSELLGAKPAVANQSSYMIRDGTRVQDPYGYNYYTEPSLPPHVPLPSEEYFTLEDSQAPSKPKQPILQPQVQEHNQYSRIESYKTIPPDTLYDNMGQPSPQLQTYHSIDSNMTVPSTGSPERLKSPCCRSAAGSSGRRQTIDGFNQSVPVPGPAQQFPLASIPQAQTRPAINQDNASRNCCATKEGISMQANMVYPDAARSFDQVPQGSYRNAAADILPQAQMLCKARNQGNTSNISTTQQPIGTSMPSPENVNQGPQSPCRSPESQRQSTKTPENTEDVIRAPQLPCRRPEQMPRRQSRAPEQQVGGIQDQQRDNMQNPSTFGEPQGFSTPQQGISPGSPLKPGRKRARASQKKKRNLVRRRLELDDDTEEGFESELDGPCHCMERMMRYRRPPVCYAYQDYDMDQCYPIPLGSRPLVTNNFTLQVCGDISMKSRSSNQEMTPTNPVYIPRNIKSVQTSFSSGDLVPTEKCSNCHRKIKSQEDLRNKDRESQLQNEVLNWLRETDNGEVNSKWGEKMQRLAHKLARPGGEEKIRQKIKKYLKRVPSQFSDCDEDRREFRKHLPDTIIKKLKEMYLRPERKRNYSSPVRIFRIEIPKYYRCRIVEDNFKNVINDWLKEIPLKKRDFLGRGIKKEEVVDSVVMKLEPYILNRQNFDNDSISVLKATIMDILNEMPFDIDGLEKKCYCNRIALSLLNDIMNLNGLEYYTDTLNDNASNHQQLKFVQKFVFNQIANILSKLHLSASTKRLELLTEELKDALMELIDSKEDNHNETIKDNIFTILYKIGGLSDCQANYFTDIILKQFKEEFSEKENQALGNVSTNTEDSNSKIYPVFQNTATVKSNVSRKIPANMKKDQTIYNEIESNTVFNKRGIIVQIENWLNELHINISFKNNLSRNEAINELAEEIANRYTYLKVNPSSKGTDESELKYLKYQIFKWISKVAGDNTLQIIEHAHVLMERIQSIDSSSLVPSKEVTTKQGSYQTQLKDIEMYFKLKRIIKHCINNILSALEDIPNRTEIVEILASNIVTRIEKGTNIDTILSEEIDKWMKNVYKGTLKWDVKDKLKCSLHHVLSPQNNLNIGTKKEKLLIRNYEDIIDEWIDGFIKTFNKAPEFRNRNECIHELAVQYVKLIMSEGNRPKKFVDKTIKWLELCFGPRNFDHDSVYKLVDTVLEYNQDIFLDLQHDEAYDSSTFRIDNQTDRISSIRPSDSYTRIDNNIVASDIAVYGFTLPSNSKAENSIGNYSIKEINADDIKASLDAYCKQLVEEIDGWLGTLNIPQIHDNGFRDIVVNDLAGDIIDRHKYLELNPSTKGSDESELEHLKYQIFKWVNKLVGEDQQETVDHASDLMNRIRSIPVPMLAKHSESSEKKSNGVTSRNINSGPTNANNTSTMPTNVRLSSPLGFTTGPMATTNKQNVVQMPLVSPRVRRGSLPSKPNTDIKDRRQSGPPALGIPKTPTQQLYEDQENLPEGVSLAEVHKYFDIIFQERIKELPFETPNPEQELLADLARKGIYNGIWKTYFTLKADPEYENDYSYFGIAFEDQLDKMLDFLPQTNDMQKIRQEWKIKVLSDVLSMLKYIHSMSDRPSFRQMIEQKFTRNYIKAYNLKESNLLQHLCVDNIAKNYILHSKYKDEDPIKANIYRQRLMNKIEELAESIKSENKVEFRHVNRVQFCQMAMKLLERVPIPHDETLTEEAEEILIGEEIDQWYNELPVKPVCNDTDADLRKRMRELLAKKLCEIEKRIDLDESAEQNLRHEISMFLQEKAELQPNVDFQINFMVEELTNRLKNRRQQNMFGYESFKKEKPVSSTFVQTDPGEVLAPLVDDGVNSDGRNPHELQDGVFQGNFTNQPQMMQGQCILGDSQLASPNNQASLHQSMRKDPTPSSCCQNQGISSNSQEGPYQQQLNPTPVSCCQGQGMTAGQVPDQTIYQKPADMSQPRRRIREVIEPSQVARSPGLVPTERFRHQSYQEPYSGPPRSANVSQNAEFAPLPSSRIVPEKMYQRGLGPGEAVYPSADFLTTDDPSTPSTTRSTARADSVPNQDLDEETDGEEDIRYKCRCMERVWMCKKHHYYEDMGRHPRCYPMPFPCRYFY